MSADLYIVFLPAQIATATTFLARLDAILSYPCCACVVVQDPACTCTKHQRPDGSPAPHVGSRTVTHAWLRPHPSDGRVAIRVDAVIVFLRNHQAQVDARLTVAQRTALYAAIDGAIALTADWDATSVA